MWLLLLLAMLVTCKTHWAREDNFLPAKISLGDKDTHLLQHTPTSHEVVLWQLIYCGWSFSCSLGYLDQVIHGCSLLAHLKLLHSFWSWHLDDWKKERGEEEEQEQAQDHGKEEEKPYTHEKPLAISVSCSFSLPLSPSFSWLSYFISPDWVIFSSFFTSSSSSAVRPFLSQFD